MILNYVDGDSKGFTEEEFANVKLCLETLLSVAAGTQPYDREFGIDYDGIVGYPIPVAQNMLSVEIAEKVEKYEPRASVESIEFTVNGDQLIPHVKFIKAEEEE